MAPGGLRDLDSAPRARYAFDVVEIAGDGERCRCDAGAPHGRGCPRGREDHGWRAARSASDRSWRAVLSFARATHGSDVMLEGWEDFWAGDPPGPPDGPVLQLAIPWILYHWAGKRGETLGGAFLRSTPVIDLEVRTYIEAAIDAPLSFFEVERVDRGRGLAVLDLLRQTRTFVLERSGSQLLRPWSIVFGKIVRFAEVDMFDGLGPTPVEPGFRDGLMRAVRDLLGARRRRKFGETMLHEHGHELLAMYLYMEEVVYDLAASRPMPTLVNTDGEQLVLCETRYAFDPAVRSRVAEQLATVEGFEDESREAAAEVVIGADVKAGTAGAPAAAAASAVGLRKFVWTRLGNAQHAHWEHTVIGRATLHRAELVLETNSYERHDRMRGLVERATAGLVRLVVTAREDMNDPATVARLREGAPPRRPLEVEPAMVQEMLRQHYQGWPDMPLPALGGRTPRQAMRTSRGKRQVDELLREMEYRTAGSALAGAYDFGILRRELGLA